MIALCLSAGLITVCIYIVNEEPVKYVLQYYIMYNKNTLYKNNISIFLQIFVDKKRSFFYQTNFNYF